MHDEVEAQPLQQRHLVVQHRLGVLVQLPAEVLRTDVRLLDLTGAAEGTEGEAGGEGVIATGRGFKGRVRGRLGGGGHNRVSG